MAIEKIEVARFLELYSTIPVFDVRSPGEYSHAHIPGAYSLPLFSDDERKLVGTAYKQQSREHAIKLGLDFFGSKMRRIIEEVGERLQQTGLPAQPGPEHKTPVIVHCWRGGMRSAGIAWLLDLYGYRVYTIIGGYKAFRKWCLSNLEQEHHVAVLGGYTGSGKTEILQFLRQKGETIIDLEGLANHKGSAFGALGMPPQPSPEMFENKLAVELYKASLLKTPIWIEDESQRIGLINIPHVFWQMMRARPLYFVMIPFEQRLEFICSTYGKLQKGELAAAITRIQKRLGPLETKSALGYLIEDNITECFRILLMYYDKVYKKGLGNRLASTSITTIHCNQPGTKDAAVLVLKTISSSYAQP